jgi:hypothetical protein
MQNIVASKNGFFHTSLYPVYTVWNIVHFLLGRKLNLELYVEHLTYPVTFVLTTALSRICCEYRNKARLFITTILLSLSPLITLLPTLNQTTTCSSKTPLYRATSHRYPFIEPHPQHNINRKRVLHFVKYATIYVQMLPIFGAKGCQMWISRMALICGLKIKKKTCDIF